MSSKPKTSARLLKARRAASKDLGLPLDHWAVKRTALLTVAHQNLEQALVEGHRVDISDLLKVEEALNAVKAALPPKPIPVTLTFVDGATGERSTDLKELRPPNKPTGPTQIDGEAVEVKPADKLPIDTRPEVEASTPAPTPAPPPPRLDPSVASASGFHNQIVGGERAPLKRLENVALQNNGHVRSGAENYGNAGPLCWVAGTGNGQHRDPIVLDPNPQRTIGHPLPTPKGNGQ